MHIGSVIYEKEAGIAAGECVMDVYFDNASTTKAIPEVWQSMLQVMEREYGNPSSMHLKGLEAERCIKAARETFAGILKCESKEIYFTSGGTESNNLAIFGISEANKRSGNHIITTAIEHASVYNPVLNLGKKGYRISFLEVDGQGQVNIDQLKQLLDEDVILVSVMAVNNEIGTIEPIYEIAEIIQEYNKKHSKRIYFHVDAVQAFGKMKLAPGREGIDAMSISGHKIHGPKGSGVLYVKNDVKITPLIYGGGQERGLRSGTENSYAIAGFGKAAELAYDRLNESVAVMQQVKQTLIDGATKIEGVVNHSGAAPHIASLSFEGIRSEVLLHALEDKGIYVSAGSACSSHHSEESNVLKAIGLSKHLSGSTLRFSFSEYNTIEEAEYTINCLEEILPVLRRFTRR